MDSLFDNYVIPAIGINGAVTATTVQSVSQKKKIQIQNKRNARKEWLNWLGLQYFSFNV